METDIVDERILLENLKKWEDNGTEAYKQLLHLANISKVKKRFCIRSKAWWNEEIKRQVKRTRKAGRKARRTYREEDEEECKDNKRKTTSMMRRKRKECWKCFLEERKTKNVCKIVKVTKNPFELKDRMTDFKDMEGKELDTDED